MEPSAQGPCRATLGALWPGPGCRGRPPECSLSNESQHFQETGWAGEVGTESHLQRCAHGRTCRGDGAQPGHHTPVTGHGELAAISSPCPQAPGCRSRETAHREQVSSHPAGQGNAPSHLLVEPSPTLPGCGVPEWETQIITLREPSGSALLCLPSPEQLLGGDTSVLLPCRAQPVLGHPRLWERVTGPRVKETRGRRQWEATEHPRGPHGSTTGPGHGGTAQHPHTAVLPLGSPGLLLEARFPHP